MNEQTEYTYDLFISYAETDRAWVEGYLLDGLTQAGVRCHSEEAFALGVPRLLEFERAIQQSQRTLLILSPAYLAESFSQFTDLLAQSYGLETATWPVIPLLLHPVELPPRLAMLTRLDVTDPAEWAAVVERLCVELQRPVPGPAPKPPCPYPGMVPFSEADSDRFFGRDREVQELLERLRLHPFVTVIGPSGSGKSSLVFAGLVPALRASGLFGSGEWLVRTLRPGEAPLAALRAALDGDPSTGLRQAQPGSSGQVPANPAQAVSGLLRTVRSDDFSRPGPAATEVATTNNRLLLVVDQFEELFTLARSDVEPFQEALLRLAETPNCYVVLTVRADFYPDLMVTLLWREIQAHRFEVLPLDEGGLRQAIVRPAEDAGVFVETALVERLVADAGREPGVLPLVQETLVLLWERVERRFLPLRAYEALVLPRAAYGVPERTGLQVAMARRADAALASLMPEQQPIARRIFLRLVQFGEGRADTRRQQPIVALRVAGDEPSLFDQTLHHLTDNRLLTLSGEEGGDGRRVDIAHESLIAGWPALQEWLAERREAEQVRRRLEGKVIEWKRLGRGSGGLLDEVELLEAERWLESPDAADLGYGEALPALVEVSRAAIEEAEREKEAARQRELAQAQALAEEQHQRAEAERQRAEVQARASRRLRWLVVGLAGVFLLALGAMARAIIEGNNAKQQARLATSRQLAAQAIAHRDDRPDLALLLSMEANRIAGTVEARGSLLDGLEHDARLITFLRSHTQGVNSIAFSPDGNTLASSSNDTTIVLWDMASNQPIAQLTGHTGWVHSVAFSPDGKTLASGSSDDTIILWDAVSGQRIGQPLTGHTGSVLSVAFSPDGGTLASGSADKAIILWDAASGQPISQPLIGHSGPVFSVVFSPDGKTLASGSTVSVDDAIILWDAASGQPVEQSFTGLSGGAPNLAFSPDGKILAAGSADQTVTLWDVATGQRIGQPLIGHARGVASVAFSPDGQTLVSGSDDTSIVLWDVATGQRIVQPLTGHTGGVSSVAFSPDGKILASGSGDSTIILWDPAARQRLGRPFDGRPGNVQSIAFSPDGQILASSNSNKTVILWDVASGRPIGQPLTGHNKEVRDVAFSPDGQILASSSCEQFLVGVGCVEGEIFLWNSATGQLIRKLDTIHMSEVSAVAFSPDGKTLASGSRDNTVILWDLASNQPIDQFIGHTGWVYSVAFSPDGRTLASGSRDNTIILWNLAADPRTDQPLTGHTEAVYSVVFSPDGRMLASSSTDRTIILWDVASGQPIGQPLTGHTGGVVSVAFSPDGRTLASGSDDRTLIMWDVEGRQPLGQPLTGHSNSVWSVVFSPDGQTLASGGFDDTIILWDVNFASWQGRACHIAQRNLSLDEWRRFVGQDEAYQCTCPDLPPGEGAPRDACSSTD